MLENNGDISLNWLAFPFAAHKKNSVFSGDGVSLLKPELTYGDGPAILRRNLALLRSVCTRYNWPRATSAGRLTLLRSDRLDLRLGLSRSCGVCTVQGRSHAFCSTCHVYVSEQPAIAQGLPGVSCGVLVRAWDFWRRSARAGFAAVVPELYPERSSFIFS